ncbi:MAG: NAD(P)-dependent oxidoreductase [bacterium]|nr:NAD(P)-dependent oxidoreductase [bacterium]MDE0289457.1 NAD(P)-dependent oxidoreductase [bacterium]MDE0437064.1 NAD(P)-dependent oxidoreductase [bacterium]
MRVGFIGLGNAGSKLAGSLLRNDFEMLVRDLDAAAVRPFIEAGAGWADTSRDLARRSDLIITCLPSPAAVRSVMEGADGVLAGLGPGKIWLEMSTTDEAEVRRLGDHVVAAGAHPLDGPVSGGCHRAATGNISIFVGGERDDFERALPVLTTMGRRILHVGPLGAASVLKVVTNYLASVHLVALGEALMTARQAGMDLSTAYEAIRISSGNSFVHETESQVILNGSYNINFTMDLVVKDMSLFQQLADLHGIPLELSPLVLDVFRRGEQVYGSRAWSSGIVRLLEDACGVDLRASGFPAEIVDDEPEGPGYEVTPAPR